MYIGNINSQIVHTDRCVHGRRLKKENTNWFHCWDEAMISGYKPCACCNPVAKDMPLRSKAQMDFCQQNGIAIRLQENELYIESPLSKWKVCMNSEGEMELLHKNTWGDKSEYHVQNYRVNTINNVLKYVAQHDTYRMHNPLPKHKKKSASPRKGSKKFNKMMKRQKQSRRKYEIKRVMDLINGLSAAY